MREAFARMTLLVRSKNAGGELTITPEGKDYWRVELVMEDLRAFCRVYEPSYNPVSGLFQAMADDWRGWEGEKTWGSLEGELGLRATHNGIGTVRLQVELGSGQLVGDGAGWSAVAVLELDAGGLDPLARAAKQLVA